MNSFGTYKFLHRFCDERMHLELGKLTSSKALAFSSDQKNIHWHSSLSCPLWEQGCPAAWRPVSADSYCTLELHNRLVPDLWVCVIWEDHSLQKYYHRQKQRLAAALADLNSDGQIVNHCRWGGMESCCRSNGTLQRIQGQSVTLLLTYISRDLVKDLSIQAKKQVLSKDTPI